MSRTEPGITWAKRTARETHIAELRGLKIGPLFPSDPGHKPGLTEPRRVARGGKDTKPPYVKAESRKSPGSVTAHCLSCSWSAAGSTWRPVKRRLAAHVGQKHRRLAVA